MKWILFLAFIAASCNKIIPPPPYNKSEIAHQIIFRTAKRLSREMELIPIGFGAQMMDEVKMLKIAFQCRRPIDIEEGRKMLVYAANEFLREINSDEKIRPYLGIYPFQPKNVEIAIFLQHPDGSDTNTDELAVIVMRDGLLQYKCSDSRFSMFKLHEEAYEEACEILIEEGEVNENMDVLAGCYIMAS